MNRPLRDLIQWRIKAALIAHELRDQKKLRVARLITQASEALEDHLQEAHGTEYAKELLALMQERLAYTEAQTSAKVIPIRKGERA